MELVAVLLDVLVNIGSAGEFDRINRLYVLDDALLREIRFSEGARSVYVALDVPIFREHPGYGSFFGRLIRRRFSNSTYLESDVRGLGFLWNGCTPTSGVGADVEAGGRIQKFEYLSREKPTMIIESDDIEVCFQFESLSVSEI